MKTTVVLPQRAPGGLRLRDVIGFAAGCVMWVLLRAVLLVLACLPRHRAVGAPGSPVRLLITGRVDSRNWCLSHLLPLTRAANVSELALVLDGQFETGMKVRQFTVPKAIGWLKPRAIARCLWAVRIALRERPDIIMAYSFFPPGLFALLAARLTGAAAIVQLAGGPAEIESGGILMDIPLVPEVVRKPLAPLARRVARHFDTIVVRGKRGAAYCAEVAPRVPVEIIPGSVNPARFPENGPARSIDIVFVGRIVPIKQPEHVCEVIRRVAAQRPGLRAVVAGNGPLLPEMKQMARERGLERTVRFAGHVERVEGLLMRSRIFLLTSYSEGLSIALAEAMMAGVVPVVANVGDLGELVINGETGWLIAGGDFADYAVKITELLGNPKLWARMSSAARELASSNNGLGAVTQRWERTFARLVEAPRPAGAAEAVGSGVKMSHLG